MKEIELDDVERKLAAQLLVKQRLDDDSMQLADEVLLAALDGSRKLTAGERAALESSPLTMRRFRHLAQARHVKVRPAWRGSAGLLRAAAGGLPEGSLQTNDGFWTLDFFEQHGRWQMVLRLAPEAPFASDLLAQGAQIHVRDGSGATMLRGALDADGECEAGWPFVTLPLDHLQQAGARFSVEPDQG